MAGVVVDRCTECTGVFFDAGELESVLKLISVFNKVKLDEPELPVSKVERERRVMCPVDGAAMAAVESGPVTFDQCPTCAGIWLDGGEIAALKLTENNIRENLNLYIRLGN